MNIQRGFRDKLDNHLNSGKELQVEMLLDGPAVYDFCCFGVDANNKLTDDRYMVFYNQTHSPSHEMCYTEVKNGAKFTISLSELPPSINKLVFTASIDGSGTMQEIRSHTLKVKQGLSTTLELALHGNDFHAEKAIISVEIYRKDVWRIAAVASGFNGGLGDLLRTYGGVEAPASKPSSPPKAQAVQSPQKISLKKGEKVSLNKTGGAPIIVENGWKAQGKDYDLKALVRYRNGNIIYVGAANRDEVLQTKEGAVKHGGDIKRPGELERITISWHPDIASVAVSSYSAIENEIGSFCEYGVFVRIKNGNQTIEINAADASADPESYTLCFGEILFGVTPDTFDVSALEMYSRPSSENRIGYKNGRVKMDIGPTGQPKN